MPYGLGSIELRAGRPMPIKLIATFCEGNLSQCICETANPLSHFTEYHSLLGTTNETDSRFSYVFAIIDYAMQQWHNIDVQYRWSVR